MPGRSLREPHPSRLPLDHPRRAEILAAHDAALEAGQPGYLDPGSGLFVMTAAALVARGTCCSQGCRHCPFVG
jgi:alkylhydroperoxidase family enzyme